LEEQTNELVLIKKELKIFKEHVHFDENSTDLLMRLA